MSNENLDKMLKRADEMFERAEKMFNSFRFPSMPTFSQDWFSLETPEYTEEPVNDARGYKLVRPPSGGFDSKEAFVEWLNGFGADGWNLNCFEYGYAIFSRYVEEEEDETSEEEG